MQAVATTWPQHEKGRVHTGPRTPDRCPSPSQEEIVSITEQSPTAESHADELVTEAVTESAAVAGKSLFLPLPPTFDSVEDERASRKAKPL